MEKEKIERINALARKAKEEGLSESEKKEQQLLREEYLANFRANFRAHLERIRFVDEDGNVEEEELEALVQVEKDEKLN